MQERERAHVRESERKRECRSVYARESARITEREMRENARARESGSVYAR